jgi:hypothetical protein
MYVWNHKLSEPSEELLNQCYIVELIDPKISPWKIKKWALEQCQSYIWMKEVPTENWSEYKYLFHFTTEADKIMFALKFK